MKSLYLRKMELPLHKLTNAYQTCGCVSNSYFVCALVGLCGKSAVVFVMCAHVRMCVCVHVRVFARSHMLHTYVKYVCVSVRLSVCLQL